MVLSGDKELEPEEVEVSYGGEFDKERFVVAFMSDEKATGELWV